MLPNAYAQPAGESALAHPFVYILHTRSGHHKACALLLSAMNQEGKRLLKTVKT